MFSFSVEDFNNFYAFLLLEVLNVSVWSSYSEEQQNEYISYIEMYGALSAMFNQKSSETGAPYLNSKYQETVYARSFDAEEVDFGNTPHDMKSKINGNNIGIGIKTWLNSKPSYQKVMQLKSYKNEIDLVKNDKDALANKLATIKNRKLKMDYNRLGLSESGNIYHYITRDRGEVSIQETAYPLVDIDKVEPVNLTSTSFEFRDEFKKYKYTFGDSQIWMMFGEQDDSTLIKSIKIDIMDDPFSFLKRAFQVKHDSEIIIPGFGSSKSKKETDTVYLPLYSYRYGKVGEKSGLNAWNGAPKSPKSNIPRPEAEVYIPIPKKFLEMKPRWFNPNIDFLDYKKYKSETGKNNYAFTLHLPDGKTYPALVGQQEFKALETNPQSALGKWLLYNVLNLSKGELVTNDTLRKAGFDSVKLWHKKIDDYENIWIDFAPIGSFERFMNGQLQDDEEDVEQMAEKSIFK